MYLKFYRIQQQSPLTTYKTPLTAIPSDDWFDADGDPEGYQCQWQIWDGALWQDITGATSFEQNFLQP
jgi:hypothetical protein